MEKVRYITIIPARHGSSRFEGKPLVDILGRPMILRVVDQARKSNSAEIFVATDDKRIAEVCENDGVKYVMTPSELPSGTDRIAVAVEKLISRGEVEPSDVIVNVQGDEPLIPPELIDQMAIFTIKNIKSGAGFYTTSTKIKSTEDFFNQNIVKVVKDKNNHALYFSRAPIPYSRDENESISPLCQRHIGMYAYTTSFLKKWLTTEECELESREKLEQLRAMYLGEKILVMEVNQAPPHGVDTPEDLQHVIKIMESN